MAVQTVDWSVLLMVEQMVVMMVGVKAEKMADLTEKQKAVSKDDCSVGL